MAEFSAKTNGKPLGHLATSGWRRGMLAVSVALWVFGSVASRADAPAQADTGPTIRLDYGHGDDSGSAVAAFMYFVPLISPEPVTAVTSPGSTQQARVTSALRRQSGRSFTTTCDFEFHGDGSQQDIFDLARPIHRHEAQLKAGRTLGKQLRAITVSGPGHGRVEVKGIVTNGVETVTQVRLRFNAQGQSSPVSIGLCDIRYLNGGFRQVNEIVARVNTLTFRREPGTPKMEVTVASVKNEGAGNGLFQNLTAGLKGVAANLLIDPLPIETLGNRTMLEFGQALTSGATSFTFPHAARLSQP